LVREDELCGFNEKKLEVERDRKSHDERIIKIEKLMQGTGEAPSPTI